MNKIPAIVSNIQYNELVMLVHAYWESTPLQILMLPNTSTSLVPCKDKTYYLLFKEHDLLISKESSPSISIVNKFRTRIVDIATNGILNRLTLQTNGITFHSLITTQSSQELHLDLDVSVTALIKPSSIIIKEIA